MKRLFVMTATCVFAAVMFYAAAGADETALYVSPQGNDSWEGTLERPFATIQKARDTLRAQREKTPLSKPATVYLRGGVYQITEPVKFTYLDSGTGEFPVTYTAYRAEKPVLSGGNVVTGWKKGKGGVWAAEVPGVKEGAWYFRQIFVNGERRQRARIPSEGFFKTVGDITMDDNARLTYSGTDIKPEWALTGDVEIVALLAWAELRMYIKSVDPAAKTAVLSRKCQPSNREKDARYYVENVREGLDAPGEWYLDRAAGALSYIPRPGEDMTKAEVIVPRAKTLMRFEGIPENKENVQNFIIDVQNIIISGLSFCCTDWSLPENGYADVQAAYDIPGIIIGNSATSITIEDCVIEHHGDYAVEFAEACSDIRIIGNEISDMGAGGVKIGEPTVEKHWDDRTYNNTISNNHIHQIGEVYPAACAVLILTSGENTISHNHIHDTYYTGISNGWSWGYAETPTRKNIIEYNLIHDIGRGMLSDMGGNYNLGVQPGSIIRNNVIYDVTSYGYGGWGIYTDEGSSEILIENNIVYRTKTGGFHQHYGRENIVRNNIFAFAKLGQVIRSRMEEHVSFTFERNIVIWDEGPLLGGKWTDDKYKMDWNLYWPVKGQAFDFAGMTLDEWRKRGQDVNSIVADPLFADPYKADFTLKPDSPAFKLGFKPIDTSRVGIEKK